MTEFDEAVSLLRSKGGDVSKFTAKEIETLLKSNLIEIEFNIRSQSYYKLSPLGISKLQESWVIIL
jgi:hypothetical protein